MIGIELRFLAGRFHGNAWHHAHNEGIPEWPPSPWRILRAMVSAAYSEELPSATVEPLLVKLAELPRYRLPLAVDAHTRHYMPDTADAGHRKAKVFDAFVAVEGGARSPQPATIGWAVELSESERSLLARLCRRVSYLGRAESWAELSPVEIEDGQWDCWPDEAAQDVAATTLLAPASTEQIRTWASAQPVPKRGPDIPRTLWDVLTFDGARYRDEGWSAVPGTRLVRYGFREPPFRRASIPSWGRGPQTRPTVARYAIRSPVLPRWREALSVCEQFRRCAMSQSEHVSGDSSPIFSGHGGSDEPSNHGHAMYLATSESAGNRGQFVDHLTISARNGFEDNDIVALQRIRRMWARGGTGMELLLVGVGHPGDFGGFNGAMAPALAESRIWDSVTPFLPTRYPKIVRGVEVDGIAEQLLSAAEQLLGVRPISVSPIGNEAEWSRFRRRRRAGSGRRGIDRPVGARLVFERPIRGPIALGFGAHFGMGLFEAAREDFQ